MFSGPLYYKAFTNEDNKVKKMAPYGGMCMIIGWLALSLKR